MQPVEDVIKIAYADDHTAMREGVIGQIEKRDNFKVILEGANGRELLSKMTSAIELPHVCLIDLSMPVMNGFELFKQIRSRWPSIPCIILTGFMEEYYILAMIKGGARGYLLKSCSTEEIIAAIQTVVDGGYYYNDILHPGMVKHVMSDKFKEVVLNDREVKILKYICDDMSYADIAVKMNTTFKSIDGIRMRMYAKLRINSKVGLVIAAIRLGYYTIESKSDLRRH